MIPTAKPAVLISTTTVMSAANHSLLLKTQGQGQLREIFTHIASLIAKPFYLVNLRLLLWVTDLLYMNAYTLRRSLLPAVTVPVRWWGQVFMSIQITVISQLPVAMIRLPVLPLPPIPRHTPQLLPPPVAAALVGHRCHESMIPHIVVHSLPAVLIVLLQAKVPRYIARHIRNL